MKKMLYSLAIVVVMVCVVFGCNVKSYAVYNSYFVNDERDLKLAVSTADNTDSIVLTQDIYIQQDIKIESSITLDLNGYTIQFANPDASIVIGKKVFSHTETYTEVVKGYYTYENKVKWKQNPNSVVRDEDGEVLAISQNPTYEIVRERVWHPAQEKVKYRNVYKYYDDIDVVIKNGTIVGANGVNGQDGKENTWSSYDGEDGKTPREPISMISGTLRLRDMKVFGGNGGNGGNGVHQTLFHVPFGGGSGGNGGNGANGANVIKVTRQKCKIYVDDVTVLIPGEGGKGGNMSFANPDYWVYRGWNGDDGEAGKAGVQISK